MNSSQQDNGADGALNGMEPKMENGDTDGGFLVLHLLLHGLIFPDLFFAISGPPM